MQIKLETVRVAFADLIEPRAFSQGQDPTFGVTSLIPKEDAAKLKLVHGAMLVAAQGKWGEDGARIAQELVREGKTCIRDGNSRRNRKGEIYQGFENHFAVSSNARADQPPRIFTPHGEKITSENFAEFEQYAIYGGCYAHVLISLWAQDNQYGRRINATIEGAVFAEHGEAFAGGRASESDVANAFAGLFTTRPDPIAPDVAPQAGGPIVGGESPPAEDTSDLDSLFAQ